MSQPRRNFDTDHRPNDTYNSIKDQLERETIALMQDRNSIQVHQPSTTQINISQNNLQGYSNSPHPRWENPAQNQTNYSNKSAFGGRGGSKTKGQLKNKIKQIIELCQEENTQIGSEFQGVIQGEKQILSLLQQNEDVNYASRFGENTLPNSQLNPQLYQQSSQQYNPQFAQQTNSQFTHQHTNPQFAAHQTNPQFTQPNHQQVFNQHSDHMFQMPNMASQAQTFDGERRIQGETKDYVDKSDKSQVANSKNVILSQDALQLIEQIERKALNQIQKLRDQKLVLINSLNQEIRNTNLQRQKNVELQRQLLGYRGQNRAGFQGGQGASALQNRQEQELRSRVAYLQNLLGQQQEKSEYLKKVLSTSSIPDVQILFQQGQAIRQDTIRLIQLKEQKLMGSKSAARLSQGQVQSQQEINFLKGKIEQLQSQNYQLKKVGKKSHDINQEYSPIPKKHIRTNSYRNSAKQYESIVSQMKRVVNGGN